MNPFAGGNSSLGTTLLVLLLMRSDFSEEVHTFIWSLKDGSHCDGKGIVARVWSSWSHCDSSLEVEGSQGALGIQTSQFTTSSNKLSKQWHQRRSSVPMRKPSGDSSHSNHSRNLIGRYQTFVLKKNKLCNKNCSKAIAKEPTSSNVWLVSASAWKKCYSKRCLTGGGRDEFGEQWGKRK